MVSLLSCFGQIIVAKVLAAHGQLMAYQIGQYFFQLQEQPLARHIVVGPHVKRSPKIMAQSIKQLHILFAEGLVEQRFRQLRAGLQQLR